MLARTALARNHVPTTHGSPAKVIVRVDLDTLAAATHGGAESDHPVPAELADGHPVSSSALVRILCTADVVPVLVDALGNPLDVGRAHRLFTPKQWTALVERDRGCTWPRCTAPPEWCDAHHLTSWVNGGRTDIATGALLCGRHHRYVHAVNATGSVINGQVVWHETGSPPLDDPPEPARPIGRHLVHHLVRQWLVPRRE